jgi:GT2 family glycosyltransferase
MNHLQIEPIAPANVETVVRLLQERNGTMPSYTRWKYRQYSDSRFQGVVATLNGEPVGCFGVVARHLRLPEGGTMPCGWFADWYVTPRARASGVGTEMLRHISQAYPVTFGHPGPEKAQSVCLANGYRSLDFQSRRRLICRRYAYERTRTKYFVKAAANVLVGLSHSAKARRDAKSFFEMKDRHVSTDSPAARFANVEDHREWVLSQPTKPQIARTAGTWTKGGLEVIFIDDQLPTTGLRRRILYTDGNQQFLPAAWKPFIQDSLEAGCIYVELFTTDVRLDMVWATLGARSCPEAPVLIYGKPNVTSRMVLHGWDRENWTFFADGVTESENPFEKGIPSSVSYSDDVHSSARVSVVVATYRRRNQLLKVLDHLVSQTHQPEEVFVVDASPAAERLAEKELSRYPKWLHYVVVLEHGNVSRQRNEALKRCVGDIVLFLDDDVEFESDLIAKYLDAFRETRADGISGVVLLPDEKLSNVPKLLNPVPIEYPGAPNHQAFDGILDTHVICTASFAASRSALREAGGFDEQLHGILDDVDLGIRMKEKGFRVIHHNKPQVLHLKLRANGARSPEFGPQWAVTNLFYFQFRHYWKRYRPVLLMRTLWDYCHPSRHWLTPAVVERRSLAILESYREAARRVSEGPKLCAAEEGPAFREHCMLTGSGGSVSRAGRSK